MNSFKKWCENADMIEKDENGYYDLETGIAFAQDKYASNFSLKGSEAQKKWADDIISKMFKDDLNYHLSLIKGTSAKFWIENRNVEKHLVLCSLNLQMKNKNRKKILKDLIKDFKSREWASVSYEEKQVFYGWNNELSSL